MIRVSVRTLTLNVLKVNDEEIRNFLIHQNASYFRNLLQYFASQLNKISLIASSNLFLFLFYLILYFIWFLL